jgi:hypothetical protein
VSYEIISIENGDVLSRLQDRDAAIHALITYVEANQPEHPGIEQQVAIVEVGEDNERHELLTYAELAHGQPAILH